MLIRYGIPTRLKLKMDRETAESLVEQKVESLGDRSFKEVFMNSLQDVLRERLPGIAGSLFYFISFTFRSDNLYIVYFRPFVFQRGPALGFTVSCHIRNLPS